MNSSAICCGIYGVPVLALLDNSRTHYVEPLLDLLRQHPRLRMEHFSSYAPEPNSEEGVWSLAKREPAQGCPNDVDELMDDLIRSIDAIRSSPRKLRGCIPPIRASLSFALAIAVFTQSSIIQKNLARALTGQEIYGIQYRRVAWAVVGRSTQFSGTVSAPALTQRSGGETRIDCVT